MIPRLYHASSFLQTVLQPGIAYTGEKVQWDETESNEWLYATTDKEAAIEQGLASAVEHRWPLHQFKSQGDNLLFVFDEGTTLPTRRDLERLTVYLYTIHPHVSDGWQKNNNPVNDMTTEYKTQAAIRDRIVSAVKVDLSAWLRHKDVGITAPKPAYKNW